MSASDDHLNPMIGRARQLRTEMTEVEKKRWHRLRHAQLGVRFRRQCPIGPYVADFACHDPKLIIELDGGQHSESAHKEYDERRTGWLRSQSFEIMRFWNFQVNQEMEAVIEAVYQRIQELKSKGV